MSGSRDAIAFTDLGRIVAFESDPAEQRGALQQGFRSCDVFARLFDESAKGVRIDPSKIASRAVLSHGVSPASRGSFMRSFVQSAVAASFADEVGDEVVLRDPNADDVDVEAHAEEDRIAEPTAGRDRAADASRARAAYPVVLRQPWPIASGELVLEIRSANPIPAKAFAEVAKAVEQLEHLANALGRQGADDEDEDGRDA